MKSERQKNVRSKYKHRLKWLINHIAKNSFNASDKCTWPKNVVYVNMSMNKSNHKFC